MTKLVIDTRIIPRLTFKIIFNCLLVQLSASTRVYSRHFKTEDLTRMLIWGSYSQDLGHLSLVKQLVCITHCGLVSFVTFAVVHCSHWSDLQYRSHSKVGNCGAVIAY